MGKTSQWNKKDKGANKSNGTVTELRPKEQPAVPAAQIPTEVMVKPPAVTDYFPYNEDGSEKGKTDGFARIMLMVDKENGTMFPIMWFNASIIEVPLYTAEANRVATAELAMAIGRREASFQEEKEQAVFTALKKLGIIDGPNPEEVTADPGTDPAVESGEE